MALYLRPLSGGGSFSGTFTETNKAQSGISWRHTLSQNPTTRPNGAVLEIGDRINVPPGSPSSGNWVWNGLFWVSQNSYAASRRIDNLSNNSVGGTQDGNIALLTQSGILFEQAHVSVRTTGVHDASNFWSFTAQIWSAANNIGVVIIEDSSGLNTATSFAAGGTTFITHAVNVAYTSLISGDQNTNAGVQFIRMNALKTGLPANIWGLFALSYRCIR